MNANKLILSSAALLQGVAGVACLFLPEVVAGLYASSAQMGSSIPIQQLGAAVIGLAVAGWLAKDSPIGGLYGRPIALGNFAHFLIGALLLARAAINQPAALGVWGLCAVYSLFALLLGYLLFFARAGKSSPT